MANQIFQFFTCGRNCIQILGGLGCKTAAFEYFGETHYSIAGFQYPVQHDCAAIATVFFGFVRRLIGKSIDELRDDFTGLSYFSQDTGRRLIWKPLHFFQNHFRIAENCVEGRAQLMPDKSCLFRSVIQRVAHGFFPVNVSIFSKSRGKSTGFVS